MESQAGRLQVLGHMCTKSPVMSHVMSSYEQPGLLTYHGCLQDKPGTGQRMRHTRGTQLHADASTCQL